LVSLTSWYKMYPPQFEELIKELARLPGLGPRSGERIALFLLENGEAEKLAQAILKVKESIRHCPSCGNITDKELCRICSDPKRDSKILCVVEEPCQLEAIEKTGEFRGRYFVLRGKITPWEGKETRSFPLKKLMEKLKKEKIEEVILAVNEEFTALYLGKFLKPLPVKVTRLGRGLPVGARIEYADQATLLQALKNRSEV